MTLSDLPGLGAGDAEAFNQADFDEVSIPESGGEELGPSVQAHKLPMLGNVTAGSIQKSELCGCSCYARVCCCIWLEVSRGCVAGQHADMFMPPRLHM